MLMDIGVLILVLGPFGAFCCGADVPRPTGPGPEYERPAVAPWPPVAEERRRGTTTTQAALRAEDAGDGSGRLDVLDAQ